MGEVSTSLMSPDTISFKPDSLYSDIEARVKERSRQHAAKSMAPEAFARGVVTAVLKQQALGRGEGVWEGTNAWLVWALSAVGWRKVFDGVVRGPVGFDRVEVRRAIFERGQRSVQIGRGGE